MQFTQDEALELLSLLASFGEESLWQALLQAGCFEVPERLLVPDVRFQLGTYCDVNAEQDYRFDVRGVRLLARLFALPAVIVTESNDRCHVEEATALLLFRLSFPRCLHDMASTFGRSRPAISRIFLWMIDYVDARYRDRMYFHLGVMGQRSEYAARPPEKDTDLKTCSAKCTAATKGCIAFSFKD
ncbi:hypothetical protein Pcac1_g8334 [Phytophthora cactorum]|uniref:Uncharacterized protein n=2 Tax=Phytophthora cactorum TaxID=29920 RepID=A0A8T1ET67_9STRA|nr:hypothetical protein Pcac1_g8334 [Phytophthora cactorum]KAG2819080.1 hypothetical protein PC112_g12352 [Phytophthora cactorum]KAG2820480.1 hypothetical protein PC111_g11445 [Phytophthora cactorum]KAG2960541.1 hypothetical protein PC118_g22454 [Phytophthora cactorum]KAG3011073.1 hypothetical protein PC119_g13338 [Phytophthora cactorum]